MLILRRPGTDPFMNMAAEEYYVKHASEDMCMIWINEKSIIIGKHQNAYAEINYPYVTECHIPIVRRISGGGAVYHDVGNVNFSFISKTGKINQVDFRKFTSVIEKFMLTFGIEINVSKRNSLFIGDQKFSGHAEHIYHETLLHHGTILFNSDLEVLEKSITPYKNYDSKAMKSVRSKVMNIAPLLPNIADIQIFANHFVEWLLSYYPDSKKCSVSSEATDEIAKLAESKYKTWEWNFGYSPAYSFIVILNSNAGCFELTVRVENGRIKNLETNSYNSDENLIITLKEIEGTLHKEDDIDAFVKKNMNVFELAGINTVSFRKAFFT